MAKHTRAPSKTALQSSREPKTDLSEFDYEQDEKAAPEPVKAEGSGKSYQRNLSGTKEIFTDLFKLMTSVVIKYEGWAEADEHPDTHPQKFSHWEHTHPFRTYDKKGQKITTSTPIGGHFHIVEWDDNTNPDLPPVIKSVSGPMVMGKKKIRGRVINVPVPANEYDTHTHDIEYLRSSKISFSTTNLEAAQVIAWEAQKTAPIPGVAER